MRVKNVIYSTEINDIMTTECYYAPNAWIYNIYTLLCTYNIGTTYYYVHYSWCLKCY